MTRGDPELWPTVLRAFALAVAAASGEAAWIGFYLAPTTSCTVVANNETCTSGPSGILQVAGYSAAIAWGIQGMIAGLGILAASWIVAILWRPKMGEAERGASAPLTRAPRVTSVGRFAVGTWVRCTVCGKPVEWPSERCPRCGDGLWPYRDR